MRNTRDVMPRASDVVTVSSRMNIGSALALVLLLALSACRKRVGDTCALQDGERACGDGLVCASPTPGLVGLFNERGTCRAVVAATSVVSLPFDAASWKKGDPTKQIGMARTLAASPSACASKTARDLERDLGPPDRVVARDSGAAGSSAQGLSWHLGLRESGASMMVPYDEYLTADLDAQGVCIRLYLRNED